ncbi:MAG: GNAT family N-acetyltransferase [Methylophagaceae bacterium]
MSCIIRQAIIAYIGSLVALLKELFEIEEDFVFDENKQRRGLELLLTSDNDYIMVAEHDSEVIAMCTVITITSTAEGGHVGLIEDMVVQKAYACKGIGRKLLSAVELWAKEQGLTRLQLLADRNNQHALIFYDKMDWQQTQLIGLRKFI